MLLEPGHFRKDAETGFRFLVLSHTLLSYLSALGAHRATLPEDASDALLDHAGERLAATLDELAQSLASGQPVAVQCDAEEALARQLEQLPEELDDGHRLVQSELALICRQLAPLRSLVAHVLKAPGGGAA
ncbi:integral membrane protein, YccS/YhfK family [compost metagenome]